MDDSLGIRWEQRGCASCAPIVKAYSHVLRLFLSEIGTNYEFAFVYICIS